MDMKIKFIYLMATAAAFAACNEPSNKVKSDVVNNPISADVVIATPTDSSISISNNNVAEITFEKTVHDFGNIMEGEKAEFSFKFTNTGNKQLIISNVSSSCGCTVPTYTKEPVEPGGSGFIKVVFNSEKRIDHFEKAVTIVANTNPIETRLLVRGFVINNNP
jgi:hypothetical protein